MAQRLAAGRRVIAVVKADAYGHGAVARGARARWRRACDALATWSVGEAAALRDAGIAAPLLVLAGVRDARRGRRGGRARAHRRAPRRRRAARCSPRRPARRRGARVRCTSRSTPGCGGWACRSRDAESFSRAVAGDPALALDGVMTHFARADEPDLAPTREQLRAFAERASTALRRRGVAPACVHAANSAALVAQGELGGAGTPAGRGAPGHHALRRPALRASGRARCGP